MDHARLAYGLTDALSEDLDRRQHMLWWPSTDESPTAIHEIVEMAFARFVAAWGVMNPSRAL
jgi:hypothetical protein